MASANNCIINAKDEYSEYFMHYAVYIDSCINLKRKAAEITEVQTHLYPAFEIKTFNKYVPFLKFNFQTSDARDFLD